MRRYWEEKAIGRRKGTVAAGEYPVGPDDRLSSSERCEIQRQASVSNRIDPAVDCAVAEPGALGVGDRNPWPSGARDRIDWKFPVLVYRDMARLKQKIRIGRRSGHLFRKG